MTRKVVSLDMDINLRLPKPVSSWDLQLLSNFEIMSLELLNDCIG
jgi:hypothetical protein